MAVPPETYPDLQINPQNSYTEYSEEERLKSCIQALGDILVEMRKAWRRSDERG